MTEQQSLDTPSKYAAGVTAGPTNAGEGVVPDRVTAPVRGRGPRRLEP